VSLADVLDEFGEKFGQRFAVTLEARVLLNLLDILRADEHIYVPSGEVTEFLWVDRPYQGHVPVPDRFERMRQELAQGDPTLLIAVRRSQSHER
jgi:hypothetical protein